jgi:hypothetical protein
MSLMSIWISSSYLRLVLPSNIVVWSCPNIIILFLVLNHVFHLSNQSRYHSFKYTKNTGDLRYVSSFSLSSFHVLAPYCTLCCALKRANNFRTHACTHTHIKWYNCHWRITRDVKGSGHSPLQEGRWNVRKPATDSCRGAPNSQAC